MGEKLVLIGGGGHCRSVLDAAVHMGTFEEIVITDQLILPEKQIMGFRVAGDDSLLPQLFQAGFHEAFISVGSIKSTELRNRLYQKACGIGFKFPNIVDPSAVVSGDAVLGEGIFIGKRTVINAGVRIEDMAIINTGAVIEHECYVGKFSHISVSAVVCGGCHIGDSVFIGANATVIQEINIGSNSIIGAGSLVLKDINPMSVYTGRTQG